MPGNDPRRRRSEAERSELAVVSAASRILGRRPDAAVKDVAAEAGVSRQTVYAHFPSREALLAAVLERFTQQTLREFEAAEPEKGPAAEALLGLMVAGRDTLVGHSGLVRAAAEAQALGEDDALHAPSVARLDRLVRRGRESGEFDTSLPVDWVVAALIALAHTAGAEVHSGRMDAGDAGSVMGESALRLLGAHAAEERSMQ